MKRYKVTHIMNKKQLGLILVAGLFFGTANAAVDLNATGDDPVGTVVLANENEIDSKKGADVSGSAYDVEGEIGFIIPSGETYYARIDLGGGATFSMANTSDISDNFSLDSGRASGGKGDSDAILSITGPQSDDADWTLADVTYNLKSKSPVSFTYRLYETASTAVAGGDNALTTQTADLVTFADATSMAGAGSTSSLIDVATSSKRYVNTTSTTHIMKVNIKNVMGMQETAGDSGNDVTLEAVVDEITLTATGDFTAVPAITDADDKVVTAAGKVWLDKDDKCTPDVPAVIGNGSEESPEFAAVPGGDNLGLAKLNDAGLEAVVTLTNADNPDSNPDETTDDEYFGDIEDAYLCMMTNGVSEIPEGTYRGKLSMKAADGFEAIADVDFNGSTLAKNSETVDLNFLLTPDGVFRNFVRLTNTSHVPGSNLMVTLINDAGDSVSFDLSDAGVSSELAPGASTPLININDLYAAAQAVDRGDDGMFTVEGEGMGNKLRAEFEGSVLATHLKAQALSVSTDNTTFFTF